MVVVRDMLSVRGDNRRKIPQQVIHVGDKFESAFLFQFRVVQRNLCATWCRRLLQNHRPRLLECVFVGADDFGNGRDDLVIVLAHELETRQNAANPVRLRHVVRMHDNLRSNHNGKSSKKFV